MNQNFSDEIAVRSSTGTWFNAFLSVTILFLTVEIVRLNQRNIANTQKSAENSMETVKQLKKINEKLEGGIS